MKKLVIGDKQKKNVTSGSDSYQAGKNSIKRALAFLKLEKPSKQLKNDKDDFEGRIKNCTSSVDLKRNRNVDSMGFSKDFSIHQMRLCLLEQNWINLQRLIPLLLDNPLGREPILWRLILIILLNSPESHDNHILTFLEKCVGNISEIESGEPDRCLQHFLTIQSESCCETSNCS